MDLQKALKDIVDYAEPKMDVYEFAIYMFLFRHTRLIDKESDIFGFKTLRKTLVIGVGEKNTPMSEGTCYDRLKSLKTKGFIDVVDSVFKGQKIKVYLPEEISGLIPDITISEVTNDINEIDFFTNSGFRQKILDRENWKCFYCFKNLNGENHVIEHVVSRPAGDNSYKNLVAACRTCNNKKDNLLASDFVRKLYRDQFISEIEFQTITENLIKLSNGDLKPTV